jgi:hypothetical protein
VVDYKKMVLVIVIERQAIIRDVCMPATSFQVVVADPGGQRLFESKISAARIDMLFGRVKVDKSRRNLRQIFQDASCVGTGMTRPEEFAVGQPSFAWTR